jgi:hypothetical protein
MESTYFHDTIASSAPAYCRLADDQSELTAVRKNRDFKNQQFRLFYGRSDSHT